MFLGMYVFEYVCMFLSMYVLSMYVCVSMYVLSMYVCVSMYVFEYVRMFV